MVAKFSFWKKYMYAMVMLELVAYMIFFLVSIGGLTLGRIVQILYHTALPASYKRLPFIVKFHLNICPYHMVHALNGTLT